MSTLRVSCIGGNRDGDVLSVPREVRQVAFAVKMRGGDRYKAVYRPILKHQERGYVVYTHAVPK